MNDLISRQAAIDALQKEINKGIPPFDDVMGSIRCGVRLARNIIEDLPSAQPERKTGKWIYLDKDNMFFTPHMLQCPECGNTLDKHGINAGRGDANFCPNCGTDLRGGEHED